MADGDLEALADGINSPFWQLLERHAVKEWGPSGERFQLAVREAATRADAVIELQKVIAQQDAIHALMRWPAERLKTLRAEAVAAIRAGESRRGPGL